MAPATADQVSLRRAARQQFLVDAATEIARERGLSHVTVGEVARRSGIGRSTVYSYFPSGTDLIADVIVDEMLQMIDSIRGALATSSNPREAVTAWIRAALDYIADGGHKLLREGLAVELSDRRRMQIGSLHRELASPLVKALVELNFTDAARAAYQIQSLVDACVRRIEAGHPVDIEIGATEDFILGGLGLSRS